MDKLVELLERINLPFTYHHFAEGESPNPPFVIYFVPEQDHFSADGVIYHKQLAVRFELYTDKKEPEKEKMIEQVFSQYQIYYQKESIWIEEEKLYETIYLFEMEEE